MTIERRNSVINMNMFKNMIFDFLIINLNMAKDKIK